MPAVAARVGCNRGLHWQESGRLEMQLSVGGGGLAGTWMPCCHQGVGLGRSEAQHMGAG